MVDFWRKHNSNNQLELKQLTSLNKFLEAHCSNRFFSFSSTDVPCLVKRCSVNSRFNNCNLPNLPNQSWHQGLLGNFNGGSRVGSRILLCLVKFPHPRVLLLCQISYYSPPSGEEKLLNPLGMPGPPPLGLNIDRCSRNS